MRYHILDFIVKYTARKLQKGHGYLPYIYIYISIIIVSLNDRLIWRYRHHQKFPRNGLSFYSLALRALTFHFLF